MLWLIDVIGGALLAIIFGTKAWGSATTAARFARLIIGSLAIGVFLGVLSHNSYPNVLLSWVGPSTKLFVECFIAPVFAALIVLLEWLRIRVVNNLFI